jgi:hypothetical protein
MRNCGKETMDECIIAYMCFEMQEVPRWNDKKVKGRCCARGYK